MIIPGGKDFLGRHFDDFVVGDKHSVFAWCKILLDQNPSATWPVFLSATANAREHRLTMLGARGSNLPAVRPHPTEADVAIDETEDEANEAIRIVLTVWDDKTPYRTQNALYQQLAENIRAGKIEYEPAYLDDCPGTLDETLCVVDKDVVLDIAERCGGCGRTITDLLSARVEQKPPEKCNRARPRVPNDVLRRWYEEWIAKGTRTSEEADWTAAKAEFGEKVRQDQIRQLRRVLAPKAWRKQGRRVRNSVE